MQGAVVKNKTDSTKKQLVNTKKFSFQQKQMDIERVKKLIQPTPDFPKKGILFQDIFPIFQDPLATEVQQEILKTDSGDTHCASSTLQCRASGCDCGIGLERVSSRPLDCISIGGWICACA